MKTNSANLHGELPIRNAETDRSVTFELSIEVYEAMKARAALEGVTLDELAFRVLADFMVKQNQDG